MRALRLGLAFASILLVSAAPGGELKLGETATLQGRLEIVVRFGPPNYGENPKADEKLEVPMLLLPADVRVLGGDEEPDKSEPQDVRQVQLKGIGGVDPYRLLEKEVTVTGRLHGAIWGTDYTPVIMMVEKIAARPRARSMERGVAPPTPSAERERARQ